MAFVRSINEIVKHSDDSIHDYNYYRNSYDMGHVNPARITFEICKKNQKSFCAASIQNGSYVMSLYNSTINEVEISLSKLWKKYLDILDSALKKVKGYRTPDFTSGGFTGILSAVPQYAFPDLSSLKTFLQLLANVNFFPADSALLKDKNIKLIENEPETKVYHPPFMLLLKK